MLYWNAETKNVEQALTNRRTMKNFSGQGRFCGSRALRQKHKKGLTGKNFDVFFLDTLKSTFWMEDLTKRWTQSGSFFSNIFFFSIFKKGQGGLPPSCAPFLEPVLIFLASKEKLVYFVLQILAIETAIERCSDNSRILQKDVLCSNYCALLILSYHFSNFPIIMPFDFFISFVSS